MNFDLTVLRRLKQIGHKMSTTNFVNLPEVTRVKIIQFLSEHDTLQCRLVSKEFFPRDLTLEVVVGDEGVSTNARINLAQKKDKTRPDEALRYIEKRRQVQLLTEIPDSLLQKTRILWLISARMGAEEIGILARNCQRVLRMKVCFLNPEASTVLHHLFLVNQPTLKDLCMAKSPNENEDNGDEEGAGPPEWDFEGPLDMSLLAPMRQLQTFVNMGYNMTKVETMPRDLTTLSIQFPVHVNMIRFINSQMKNLTDFALGPIIISSAADFGIDLFKTVCNDMTHLNHLLLEFQFIDATEIAPLTNTLIEIQALGRLTQGISSILTVHAASLHLRTVITRPEFGGI